MLEEFLSEEQYKRWKELQHRIPAAPKEREDEYGQDMFELALYGAHVLTSKAGIGGSTLLITLLKPFVQKGILSLDECKTLFSEKIAGLMEILQQLNSIQITDDNLADKEFTSFWVSFAKDIRIIICLTVDCYVRMQAISDDLVTPYALRLAKASKLFYSPVAHKLGLYELKRDLENLVVKFEDPEAYRYITNSLKQTREQRDAYLQKVVETLNNRAQGIGIQYEVKWRTKSISSIYAKMKNKGIDLDGIYDLYALRFIVEAEPAMEKAACWAMYGLTCSVFVPNLLRTKDWISTPKASGYESLHTTVLGPDNHWIEVQIRSRRMDEVAELGQAAHWRYKGEQGHDEALNETLTSIRAALEKRTSMEEIAENFARDIYSKEIFVFDNADRLHKVSNESRVIDYIIQIAPEPDWVELFRGARVNGEEQPLTHLLHNGDRVELIVNM